MKIMKILTLTILLSILSINAFAGAKGTGFHRSKTINGRECLYFYDHSNNLVSVSCSC